MRKLAAPAIWIPLSFGLCGLTTLLLSPGSIAQISAILGLFFAVAFAFCVVVHETGHAIGALIARFQIVNFVVGPIMIALKVNGGYKLVPNRIPHLWAGYLLPHAFDNLRRRFMIFIGGGPLASLLFGLIFASWAATVWQSWRATIPGGISLTNFNLWGFGCFLGMVGWLSLFLFATNVIPFRTKVLASDGHQLFRLSREGSVARRSTALLVINSLFTARQRPLNIPLEIIEDVLAVQDSTPETSEATLITYLHTLDMGKLEAADHYLDDLKRLGRKASTLSQAVMAHWIAFHEAIYRQNVDEARRWLNEANARTISNNTLLYHMSNASVLFLEGHAQKAMNHTEQWAILWKQELQMGGDILEFFREQMENVTRQYIADIKPLLKK